MASILKVDKLDPQSGTALEIGTSGDTVSIPSGATLDISASTLTPPATMPASSGINLTALNATNLGSGTVPTARLGTGTASSSVFLAGDNTWAAAGGGKVLQVVSADYTSIVSVTDTTVTSVGFTVSVTPAATSNKVLVMGTINGIYNAGTHTGVNISVYRGATSGDTKICNAFNSAGYDTASTDNQRAVPFWILDSPSTTSSQTYSVWFYRLAGSANIAVQQNNSTSSITLMEIDA